MTVWMLLAGPTLLALAGYDAVVTTVSTATGAGPVTGWLGRLWWRTVHRLAREPTSVLLSGAGPVVLLLTAATWLLLLWAGWTLLFAADPSAVVASTSQVPAGWWDRVYFAGFTMFTLGIGDLVPHGAPWQVATVLATVTGLALTTAAITYLVPVVTAATQRATQASMIHGFGGQAHRIVIRAHHQGSVTALEDAVGQVLEGLLLTAQRHLSYPILHYFHPRTASSDLRVQLAALDDALLLVRHGLADEVDRPHPRTVTAAQHAVDQLLERSGATAETAPPELTLAPLRAAGIATVDDETFTRRLAEAGAEDRRRRLAGYQAESRWTRPEAP